MAMDQQRSRRDYWSLWVEGDKEQTVAPGPNERLCVTGAFLVGGQGVADVCVVIDKPCGADCVPLASLSAANPCVQTSVVVYEGEECSLFVMPQGGPAVVRFDGYVVALPPAEKEGDAATSVDNEGDWYVRLESGEKERFNPTADSPVCVTAVVLPDPADAGLGVVDAHVVMGTGQSLLLASLSEETPRVELQPPVVLDEEFSFSATGPWPPGIVQFEGYILAPSAPEEEEKEDDEHEKAGSSKLDHDSGHDGEVEGLAAVCASDDEEKEEETSSSEDDEGYEDEEEEEEASSSEDDEGYQEEEDESNGDVGGHAAKESSAGGGNTLLHRRSRNFVPEAFDRELVQQVAAGALIGFCVFVYLAAFFKVMISIHLCT